MKASTQALHRRPGFQVPLLAALLATGTLLLGGCGQANGKNANGQDEAPPAVPVEVSLPKVGDMAAVYTGTAPIEADREAFVMPKVRGEIRAVLVEEGARVRAGQVLARLDGDQLRLEVAQAEANLRKLERDYARNVELQKKGLVSVTAFDNLKYELDAARATHDLARLQLSYTDIRSPIDGVVVQRTDTVKVGNTVTPVGGVIESADSALFVVTDFDSLVVKVNVPERELSKLAAGQTTQVSVDAVPGSVFEGEIDLISPRVDPATATFPVKIAVNDATGKLRPGMFARVTIVYERRADTLQIPRSALIEGDGPPTVYVVRDGKASERPIELGLANGGFVEVVSGLARDEQVVVVGQTALKNGTAVRVVNAPAPGPASAG